MQDTAYTAILPIRRKCVPEVLDQGQPTTFLLKARSLSGQGQGLKPAPVQPLCKKATLPSVV
jgi:hypothetical protein